MIERVLILSYSTCLLRWLKQCSLPQLCLHFSCPRFSDALSGTLFGSCSSEEGYSALLLVLRPSHPFLLLNQFQRVSLEMIYKEGFDVLQCVLQNAVSFPYLLTLVAFESKALQLSLSGHSPVLVCILSLLPSAFSVDHSPSTINIESPFSESWWYESFSCRHLSSKGIHHCKQGFIFWITPLNIKYYILPSFYNFFYNFFLHFSPLTFQLLLICQDLGVLSMANITDSESWKVS